MTRTSKRTIRPGFDDLEGRALLSGLMVGGANTAVAIVQQPVTPPEQSPLTLSGTITGNYISVFNTYQLIGNGPITITPPGGNPVTLEPPKVPLACRRGSFCRATAAGRSSCPTPKGP